MAAPSVRRLARELGIDLRKIRGSEAGGRVVLADVRNYIQRLIASAAKGKAGGGGATATKPVAESIDFSKWGPVSKKPLSPLRQVIARRMGESWNAMPRVTQFEEADFTRFNELRKKFAPKYEKKGARLTLTPLVLKAVAETLKKHPLFNSSLDEAANEIVLKDYYHIGIAVDTEQGLIVPVIRDVDKKSILVLAKELEQLAAKARDRKISAEELKGGTLTISNQGAIGGAHFTPIVNTPEVAILGLGRGAMKPVARDGKVVIRMMTPFGLSYDHRVIDGGDAARFIGGFGRGISGFQGSGGRRFNYGFNQNRNCRCRLRAGRLCGGFYAADLGKKVILVEREKRLGGVCLNRGCIPVQGAPLCDARDCQRARFGASRHHLR